MDNANENRIFDSHCHIFPDKIARKASDATGRYYNLPMDDDGTLDHLLSQHRRAGISHCLVCSAATRPEQVESINNFIASACAHRPNLTGFGSLHPEMKNPVEELDRMVSIGLSGIKLHPDFQHFRLDEPAAMALYEAVDNRLPILLHMGDRNTQNTTPEQLRTLVKAFPRQRFIGAHFGGYSVWQRAAAVLADTDVWVDTSSSLQFMSPGEALGLVRAYGAARCLFGSDYPMWSPKEELAALNRLELTDTERRCILWNNAAEMFGL